MTQDRRGISLFQVAVGAGLIAVAAVGVAAFVPRRKLAAMGDAVAEPFRGAMEWPAVAAALGWMAGLCAASPRAPRFNDMRPFDEF